MMKVELDKWFWAVEIFDGENREVDMPMRGDLYFGVLSERKLDFRLVGCDSGAGGFLLRALIVRKGFGVLMIVFLLFGLRGFGLAQQAIFCLESL